MPAGLDERFDALGFAIIEYALSRDDLSIMDDLFPRRDRSVAGAQFDGLSLEARHWLGAHEGLATLARRLMGVGFEGSTPRIRRFAALDHPVAANWFVPWNQDRGDDGVERSRADLERTVVLRVYLDDCDEDNGPLEVVPGSHTSGRLDGRAIAALVAERQPLLCLTVRGDIVAMRPLAVHRSQRARVVRARRVLHLEYRAHG